MSEAIIKFPNLVAKVSIEGTIELRTGMHIGGSDVGLSIGGADKLVVRSPRNDEPYIPGSSIKGKLRSLLERAGYTAAGRLDVKQKREGFGADPCNCALAACRVCKVFGVAAEKQSSTGSTRLMVRDSFLRNADEIRKWRNLDMHLTEVKTEVALDRLTSAANPRNFERVPAGSLFGLDLALNLHEGDDDSALLSLVMDGLELLSHDALGGQGSRGYGAVRIEVKTARRLAIEALKAGSVDAWSPLQLPNRPLPWVSPRAVA